MKKTILSAHAFFLSMTMLLFLLITSAPAKASALIRYQNIDRNSITFSVEVSSPAPTSLIVQHFYDRGNRLLNTSPGARQVDNSAGYAKWLLKNVQPGVYPFTLRFAKQVRKGQCRLVLRYRDPNSGAFQEKVIRP